MSISGGEVGKQGRGARKARYVPLCSWFLTSQTLSAILGSLRRMMKNSGEINGKANKKVFKIVS